MSDKQIRDCYSNILKEVINAIKEDTMLQTSLTPEQIDTLEEVACLHEKWKKNLEKKGLLQDNYMNASYFELTNSQGYGTFDALVPHVTPDDLAHHAQPPDGLL